MITAIKILIVANYRPSAGGISGQVTLLHRYLNQEGIKTDIYSTKGNVLSRLKMFYNLYQLTKEYDVVHIHCCSNVGFFPAVLGVTIAKHLRKRVICTYHGGGAEEFFKKFPWLVKCYLNKTDANIVLSGFLAKNFDKYKLMYQIVPNILPTDVSNYRERVEIKPKFISVRTLQPLYNVRCIIKAFALVKQSIPEAELCILGDGPCRKELEQLVKTLNLLGVSFEGNVPNDKVYDYLNRADIFISMPKIDNQPMSVLEAFKCGLLVISSRVGGVPYMINEGYNGMLVENDNHIELAEKMFWALNHPERSLEMMKAGHQSLSQYTWKSIRAQILSLYRQ